ncbi:hypothetical protein ACHAAC_05490 [Aeromicrobium sp. CF4.19]|uniref:hypothetical protein n=1 Tax=Aeromicrobium sp. CF4.19 TaxID=3373082 RepID=UPI003EE5F4A6
MSSDVLLLVATAVLAVVAVGAAVVATRASRQIVRARAEQADVAAPGGAVPASAEQDDAPVTSVTSLPERTGELAPRLVEGRVIVPPSRDEVVATALTRPQVRLAVLAHGIAQALRPESRDRIAALVRREYRQRRRHRLRAGRRASRAAHLAPTEPSDRWLGELPHADEPPSSEAARSDRAIGA